MGAIFAGLGRWLTLDAFKAIGWAIVGTVAISLAVSVYRDIKQSGATGAILQCQQAVAEGNTQAAEQLDQINAKALKAAQAERDKARADLDQQAARITSLEQTLRTQSTNPVCWPQDVARSLRQ